GSGEGYAAWDAWAQRYDGYRGGDTRKRWHYWQQKLPNRTGFGALFKKARKAQPGWLPPSNPAAYMSEQWLALGFVADHQDDMRYTAKWNQWHVWNGSIWKSDDTLRASALAAVHCRQVAEGTNQTKTANKLNEAKTRAAVLSLVRENQALAAVT